MQRKRVAIVGATGYAGAELTAALAHHDGAELVSLTVGTRSARPAPFGEIHPSLKRRSGPDVETFDKEAVLATKPDAVFLATPNEVSAEIAGDFVDAGSNVIDLSGAFRLKRASDYPSWYGFQHPRPDLLEEAVYGLTEWCNGELKKARIIANPGCYPTSVLLALKPLNAMLDRSAQIIIDAKSGVSGAGKKSDLAYSFAELSGNCKAYGVGGHRHTPEMKQNLSLATYTPFVFTPHLLPTVRGIISTMYVTFLTPQRPGEIAEAYAAAYANSPFVTVLESGELPELRDVVGTPRCEIGFSVIDGGKRAVVVSVIDNLLKGAATQAVQNFNRHFGFAETEGLVA